MNNNFTHQEILNFIKSYLKLNGIVNYEEWTREYEEPIIQDITRKGLQSRLYGLPAPYNFGHISIDIVDDYVSLRLIMCQEIELDESQQKIYKAKTLTSSDDIWVIDVPNNKKLSERYINHCSGYNYGLKFNEENGKEFLKLFDIIFATEYKTNYIVQLAAKHYEKNRMFNEFIELVANVWHMNKNLWSCVNQFSTQWGESSKITLMNKYNFSENDD